MTFCRRGAIGKLVILVSILASARVLVRATQNEDTVSNGGNANGANGTKDGEIDLNLLHDLAFGLNGVLNSTLCIIGIASNLFNILVLSRRQMRSATNTLLLALAVSDIGVLLFAVTYYVHFHGRRPPMVTKIDPSEPLFWKLYNNTWYMFANVFLTASNWLILSVAAFRFVAVCFPMKVVKLCCIKHARILIGVLYVAAVLLNVPDFLTIRVTLIPENSTLTKVDFNELYYRKAYLNVYQNSRMVFNVILPWLACLLLSVKLILALRSSNRSFVHIVSARSPQTSVESRGNEPVVRTPQEAMYATSNRNSNEKHISRMLILLIIWFIICEIPAIVWFVMTWIYGVVFVRKSAGCNILRSVADCFLITNYASNFFLYAVSNQFYRRVMYAILTCRMRQLRTMSVASRYKSSVVQNFASSVRNNFVPLVHQSLGTFPGRRRTQVQSETSSKSSPLRRYQSSNT